MVDEAQFARELVQLRISHIMGGLREETAGANSDEQKSAARARAKRRMSKWSVSRRRISRTILLEPDGTPICGGAESVVALRAVWCQAFSDAVGISFVAVQRFFQHFQPYTDVVNR